MNLNFSFHSLVRMIFPPTFQHSSAQFEITQELQLQTMWNLQMCIHSTAVMQVKFESYTGCVHSSFWSMSAGVTRLYISDSNAWPRGFWRFWCLPPCFSLSLCFYSAGIDMNIKCQDKCLCISGNWWYERGGGVEDVLQVTPHTVCTPCFLSCWKDKCVNTWEIVCCPNLIVDLGDLGCNFGSGHVKYLPGSVQNQFHACCRCLTWFLLNIYVVI